MSDLATALPRLAFAYMAWWFLAGATPGVIIGAAGWWFLQRRKSRARLQTGRALCAVQLAPDRTVSSAPYDDPSGAGTSMPGDDR